MITSFCFKLDSQQFRSTGTSFKMSFLAVLFNFKSCLPAFISVLPHWEFRLVLETEDAEGSERGRPNNSRICGLTFIFGAAAAAAAAASHSQIPSHFSLSLSRSLFRRRRRRRGECQGDNYIHRRNSGRKKRPGRAGRQGGGEEREMRLADKRKL